MFEVVQGNCIPWMLDRDPNEFAVLAIDPPFGKDKSTQVRDALLDWWDVSRRAAAVFGSRDVPHYAKAYVGADVG